MTEVIRRKKVLFIACQPFFEWRGSPIRIGFDVQALAELGYDVDLLVLPLGDHREIPGVRVIRVPNVFMAKRVAIGPSLLKAAFAAVVLLRALSLVVKKRYDVVHCVEDAGPIGVVVARLRRSRLVFEKHSDPSSYKKGLVSRLVMWLYEKVERMAIRHADAAIGTGPGLVHQIQQTGTSAAVHHIFDIPSSLAEPTAEQTREIRNRLRQADGELLVTFVGSFAVYQGIDLLFEAIAIVAKRNPSARFIIVGGTPAEIACRGEWLRARQAANAVTFVGRVSPDALPAYLAASDVLLSPRLAGVNTPLKLLDYLKAGGAIVATDVEANRLILDETAAVFAKPDAAAFADSILSLLADPARRAQLRGEAFKRIRETYSYSEFKRRLETCYRRCLGS